MKNFLMSVCSLITIGIILFFVSLYGPFKNIREMYVTSAMTTMNHKYMATIFFDDEEIDEIMDKNSIEIPAERVYPQEIVLEDKSEEEMNKIELVDISRNGFKGYLLKVNDPKRVFIGASDSLGKIGIKVLDAVNKHNAIGGINAGGFSDDGGQGTGGEPSGLLIMDGKVRVKEKASTYNIIGFNKDDVLIIGSFKNEEIDELNLRDAICFRPFLIMNGEPMIKSGNGGWGLAPRTAIGQTKDGTVLMLAIDGRQVSSLGATLKDVQDIMLENGAINAANLDGGASTTLVYQGKILNHPCSLGGDRYVPSVFLIRK